MKNNLFTISCTIVLVSLILLSGCFGFGDETSFTVGLIVPDSDDAYYSIMVSAITSFAAEDSQVTLVTDDSGGDSETAAAIADDMINTRKVDYLIVIPPWDSEPEDVAAIVTEAVDSGVPLFFAFDNPYRDGTLPENTHFCEYDQYDGAVQTMAFLAEELGGSGNICIVRGPEDNPHADARVAGYNDELADYPQINVLATGVGNWSQDSGNTIADGWLADPAYDDLDAIICNNDSMALGAISALSEAARTGVLIVGFDGVPDALTAIENGTMLATAYQLPDTFGQEIIDDIIRLIDGETLDQVLQYPLDLITAENVSEYQD